MIWAILAILVLAVLLYIGNPLWAQPSRANPEGESLSVEHEAYLAETESLESRLANDVSDDEKADLLARKVELERALLSVNRARAPQVSAALSKRAFSFMLLFIAFGAAGLYLMIGRPDYQLAMTTPPKGLPNLSAMQAEQLAQQEALARERAQMEGLIAELKSRLDAQPEQPEGWLVYARSLMQLGRFDEALSAYDIAVAQNNDLEVLVDERSKARAFAAQQSLQSGAGVRGPSADDVAAVAGLSQEDQALMIDGMVASLAARLEDNPDDAAGWAQLLRARKVLDQQAQARADIARVREVFAGQPDTAEAIIAQSGWEP